MLNHPYFNRTLKLSILFFFMLSGGLNFNLAYAQPLSVENIHDLGVQSINGDNVPVDLEKGRHYIYQSAIRGYPLGQFHLGILFYTGDGGVQNTPCAKWWLEKALLSEGEVHDMAQDALAEINEESAMLSLQPRVIVEKIDEHICHQSPITDNDSALMEYDLPPMIEPKIDLEQLQKAIIALPQISSLTTTLIQNLHQPDIGTIIRIESIIHHGTQAYRHSVQRLSKNWERLEQYLINGDKTKSDMANNKNHPEQIRPLDIVQNPPEEPEEVTITILLSPEQEAELAKKIETPDEWLKKEFEKADEQTQLAQSTNKNSETETPDLVTETNNATLFDKTPVPQIEEPLLSTATSPAIAQQPDDIKPTPEFVAPKVVKSANPPSSPSPANNLGGNPQNAPPRHYTIQVGSASHPSGLHEQARRHKLSNYLVYETVRNGRQWYVLVYGEYPNMTSAKRALKSLPSAIQRDKPWVRSLQQVQSELH